MKEYSFKEYFYLAHCEGKQPSSKRLWGAFGFAVVQLCLIAATVLSFVKTGELSSLISNLLEFDLITSAALLGLSTIAGAFGGGKNVSIGQPQQKEEKE